MIQPNTLTISRIILTVIFILLILQEGLVMKSTGLLVFGLASLTDYYDGLLAKKYNLVTNFGKIMDPIADKVLMLSAFWIFTGMGLIQLWMFVVIFIREVGISVMRFIVIGKGKVLAAEYIGKFKTVAQIVAVFSILIYLVLIEIDAYIALPDNMFSFWYVVNYVFMVIVVILTVWSGLSYLWTNRKLFYVK